MGKVQQQTGKRFEDELLELLKDQGFRAHKLKTGISGTAFDIMAVKDSRALAFECKTIQDGNYISYTQELRKKIDELDWYEDGGKNDLYLVVRFGGCDIRFLRWGCAKKLLAESGRIGRGQMSDIRGLLW